MKTAIIATLQLLVAFMLVSCAHTYTAPDPAKVKAKTVQVQVDQKKAHALNAEIKTALKTSQEHSDAIVIKSNEIEGKIEELIKVAPPEMQPALAQVQDDLKIQRMHEDALGQALTLGYTKQAELETHLTLTDTHISDLTSAQVELFAGGQTLAEQATNESKAKAIAQRKNWSFTIISASLVIGVVLLVVFWKVVMAWLKGLTLGI